MRKSVFQRKSKSRLARALKYVPHVTWKIFFVRCIPKICRVGVVLRAESWFYAHSKFYRTSAGKSTFPTQKDTDKGKFRCTWDTEVLMFSKLYFIPKKLQLIILFTKFKQIFFFIPNYQFIPKNFQSQSILFGRNVILNCFVPRKYLH